MNLSSLKIGQRVRFVSWFTNNGKPYDPETVTCVVISPTSSNVYTLDSGLTHDEVGAYSVIVVLGSAGRTVVRFTGDGTFTDQIYQVDRENPLIVQAVPTVNSPKPESNIVGLQLDAMAKRASMIDKLNDYGIKVDPTRSDAFVMSAYETMLRRSGAR